MRTADEESDWRSPPAEPSLDPDDVHLWRIPLRREPDLVAARALLLTTEERARMQRFRFDVHRERFALRRGALRILLGRYLGADPRSVTFRHSARGKPELGPIEQAGRPALEPEPSPGEALRSFLRFNLSDSADWALLGVTLERRIGVDIEHRSPTRDLDALARRYFSSRELAEYMAIGPSQRLAGFYNCWTRKEAWLKARGDGLSAGLDSFEVTLDPSRPPSLLSVANEPDEARRWRLYAMTPAPEYAAAIAVERDHSRLVKLTFDDLPV